VCFKLGTPLGLPAQAIGRGIQSIDANDELPARLDEHTEVADAGAEYIHHNRCVIESGFALPLVPLCEGLLKYQLDVAWQRGSHGRWPAGLHRKYRTLTLVIQ
jgi:hypothetical protein